MVNFYKFILFIFFLSFGLTKEIQVIDGISGRNLPSTKIIFQENDSTFITDENGIFIYSNNDLNSIQLIKQGYNKKTLSHPFPNRIKLFPIIFQHDIIDVTDTLINPYFQLNHPINIQAIKSEFSSSQNITNIFNKLPGITVKSYGGIGGVKTLSLNGGQGDRLQILFNGISINNEQSGNADISQLPKSLLNKIQFIPIGSSSRFGNSAMSGIINIDSGFKPDFDFEIEYFKDSYSFNYSNSIKTNHMTAGIISGILDAYQKNNWIETGDYNPAEHTHKSYNWFKSELNQKYISPWFNYKGKNYNISSIGLFIVNNRIHSSKIYGPQYHPKISDGLNLLGFSYKKNKFKSNFSFKNQWIKYKTDSPFTPYIEANHKLNIYKIDNEYLYSDISIFNRNILTISNSNSTNPSDTSSFNSQFGFTYRNFNHLINIHITARTVLEKQKIPVNSYELIINKYFSNKFHFSAIYSRNFKKPNFNDLYWTPFGNKNLQTEFSDNYYLNSKYYLNHLKINILSHYIIYKNMIIWLPKPGNQDYWYPDNIESTISYGHIVRLDIKIINSTFSISQNSTIDKTKNSQIPYTPEWIFSWTSDYQLSNLKFLLSYNYQSFRYINYSNYNNNSLQKIPAYFKIDLNAIYNFNLLRYQSSIGVFLNNLMDTRFQSVYGYPEPGRTYGFQLTIK